MVISRTLFFAATTLTSIACTSGGLLDSQGEAVRELGAPPVAAAVYESAMRTVGDFCSFTNPGRCTCSETTWCSPDTSCVTQTGVVNTNCDSRMFGNDADCRAGCGPFCRSSAACSGYSCTTAEGCADARPIPVDDGDDDCVMRFGGYCPEE